MATRRKTKQTQVSLEDRKEAYTPLSGQGNDLNRPQTLTAVPTLKLTAYVTENDTLSYYSEFHMTIQSKISNLTPKQASMLLAVACFRAVHVGIDISLYMTMEFLSNLLRKSGHDPLTIKDEKQRKTVMLSDVILSYVRGQWLTFKEYEDLPLSVIEEIENLQWLPDERTMQSWKQHWDLEKYLQIKIVPVEALLNRSEYQTAERYTAYTKGYGNDGSPADPGKTKPSPELDGEDSEDPPPSLSLQEFEEYQTVIRLIEYAKSTRRQAKK